MSPRQMQCIVRAMAGKSDEAVDRELKERRLSPEHRVAVKCELAAVAQRPDLAASLATDGAEWHPGQPAQPLTEIERLMRRAGLIPGGKYTEVEIDEGCRIAGITSPTDRLAVKLECEQCGMLTRAKPSQGTPWLYAMRASADERPAGKVLLDADGYPLTLRSVP